MFEKLFELKVTYESLASLQGSDATVQRAAFGERLVAAFPDLFKALVHAIDENGHLRDIAAQAMAPAPSTASPLAFEGFLSVHEGGVFDTLQEYAAFRHLVIGDTFVISETYMRGVRYRVEGGPAADDPLRPFRFVALDADNATAAGDLVRRA